MIFPFSIEKNLGQKKKEQIIGPFRYMSSEHLGDFEIICRNMESRNFCMVWQ
jgi:hypothetical protein